MFDTIGRDRDDDFGRRRAKAMSITGAIGLLGFALGYWLTPVPPPPLEPGVEVTMGDCLDCDVEEPEPEKPPAAPIHSAPAGIGEIAEPTEPTEPRWSSSIPSGVRSQQTIGTGTDPTGIGTGGNGNATQGCVGEHCASGGGGSQLLHHSKLKILDQIQPSYPREARRLGLDDARCFADLSIDERGAVYEVKVHDCPPTFHRATREALLLWRFEPVRTLAGDPVEARTRIAVTFQR